MWVFKEGICGSYLLATGDKNSNKINNKERRLVSMFSVFFWAVFFLGVRDCVGTCKRDVFNYLSAPSSGTD